MYTTTAATDAEKNRLLTYYLDVQDERKNKCGKDAVYDAMNDHMCGDPVKWLNNLATARGSTPKYVEKLLTKPAGEDRTLLEILSKVWYYNSKKSSAC